MKNVVSIMVTLFVLVVVSMSLSDIWPRVLWATETMLTIAVWTVGILAAVITAALVLRVYDWLRDMFFNTMHARRMADTEYQKAEREANFEVVVAAPGSLIVANVTNNYQVTSVPLHLLPGPVNGRPSAFDDAEVERWTLDKLANAQARGSGKLLPGPAPVEVIEPLLPKLVNAQRLIIAGGSDAGKSTLAKHLIAARADHSHVIPIDPHSPSKLLGYDVIGAGRNYPAIGDALGSLVLMMDERYTDIAGGTFGYNEHQRITILVDEWTSINEKVPDAGAMLKTLLTESRKVNMHLVVMVHSLTSNVLGIDAQIRASAVQVQLEGGNGNPRRGYILPTGKGPNSSRKEWAEYALPGPFAGYVEPVAEVVVDLPDQLELKARSMANAGYTPTRIARELLNGGNPPNGRQIAQIKAILESDKETT